MTTLSGSLAAGHDWANLPLVPDNWDVRLGQVETRLDSLLSQVLGGQFFALSTPTDSFLSIQLFSGGRITISGSGFLTGTNVVVNSFSYSNTATGDVLSFAGTVDNVGSESLTSFTLASGGLSVSMAGNITIQQSGAFTAPASTFTISDNGSGDATHAYKLILGGDFTFNGVDVGGTVRSLNLTSQGDSLKIGGIAIPASVLNSVNSGDDILALLPGHLAGNDTLSYNAAAGIALDAEGGNDSVTGGVGPDTLTGGAGNDTLDGGAGVDTLTGGTGNDTYVYDGTADTFVENPDEGTDTVRSNAASYTLPDGLNIENVTLGIAAALNATGNSSANVLTGNASANLLDGGAGADTMAGGAGNDTYIVDDAGDKVNEAASAGNDTVQSSITYALPANVENLTLTGTADIDGTGNGLANILTGNDGVNVLTGGAGNDVYNVQNTGDTVVELPGGGFDAVFTTVSFTLGTNVERLVLVGDGITGLAGTGNALANRIEGTSAGDTLDGAGGADTMVGGNGDDRYFVDSTADVVTESSLVGGGTDTVVSSLASYTLAANVENLELAAGSANLNGTGNGLANIITGNDGNNVLAGGAGADTLAGGAGNDVYVISVPGQDTVVEDDSGGTDTVRISYNVTSPTVVSLFTDFSDVENVEVLGTGAFSLTGNSADNLLKGNASVNTLIGNDGNDTLDGGAGLDSMVGGAGNDLYVLSAANEVPHEAPGEGTSDTVRIAYANAALTAVTLNVSSYANIENLEVTGTGLFNLAGTDGVDNVLVGNGSANVIDGGTGADTMIGGAGGDVYKVDDAGDVVIDTVSGGTDRVEVAATLDTFTLDTAERAGIEQLKFLAATDVDGTGNALANRIEGGAGNDSLLGLGGNDTLIGNAGDDTLDGGAGNDSMAGGTGDDQYAVDSTLDVVTEAAGDAGGTQDVVVSSLANYTLAANVENLQLADGALNLNGTGNGLANVITGNDGNNLLSGGAGNDALDGGAGNDTLDGGTGSDSLVGGTGNDLYVLNVATDAVDEAPGDNADTVRIAYNVAAATTIDLSSDYAGNVENVEVLGTGLFTLIGNDADNILKGNASINTLDGGIGNDTLDGGGGLDVMSGGTGDDVYVVSAASERPTELADEGNDTVRIGYSNAGTSALTVAVGTYANIENLEVAGTGLFNLTGDGGGNALKGNGSANVLDGGAGADTMSGGAGGDVYKVDDAGDVVIDSIVGAGGGTDRVDSSYAIFSLDTAGSAGVEQLKFLTTDNATGTGNAIANRIEGNAGNDSLSGLGGNDTLIGNGGNDTLDGGSGNDSMAGGAGDDRYLVDSATDVVSEAAGAAGGLQDVVVSSLSAYTLAANVENLELASGVSPLKGTGNGLANHLTGNDGDNTLNGAGGNDTLEGGAGNDQFLFATAPGASNVDTILGFLAGSDTLAFDKDVFTGLAVGALDPNRFFTGTAAAGPEDRFVYDDSTGNLYYDANGSAAGSQVLVAVLDGHPTLTAADIQIVA